MVAPVLDLATSIYYVKFESSLCLQLQIPRYKLYPYFKLVTQLFEVNYVIHKNLRNAKNPGQKTSKINFNTILQTSIFCFFWLPLDSPPGFEVAAQKELISKAQPYRNQAYRLQILALSEAMLQFQNGVEEEKSKKQNDYWGQTISCKVVLLVYWQSTLTHRFLVMLITGFSFKTSTRLLKTSIPQSVRSACDSGF